MTTINDISDLIRVLQEHSEWRQALRGIILDQDLTNLPQQVDQRSNQVESSLAEFKTEVNQRFNQVDQRFDRVDQRFDRVESSMVEFKAEVDQRFNQVDQRFDRVESSMVEFKAEVDQRFNQVDGRLDNMAGTNYELKVEKNIRAVAPQHMGLRSVKVVHGTLSGMDPNLQHAIEQAADNGAVTWDEAGALMAADLIFEARSRTNGAPVHVVAEISITAGEQDVTRAKDRAQTLEKALGTATAPAVVCSRTGEHARRMAAEENVIIALLPD